MWPLSQSRSSTVTSTHKVSLCYPFVVNLSPLPLATSHLFFVLIILPFPQCYVNRIIKFAQLPGEPGACITSGQAVHKSSTLGRFYVCLPHFIGKEIPGPNGCRQSITHGVAGSRTFHQFPFPTNHEGRLCP